MNNISKKTITFSIILLLIGVSVVPSTANLIVTNKLPCELIIDGPTLGYVGVPYSYSFYLIDPECDEVYYDINWGDGTVEEWIGPFKSGEEVTRSHTWSDKKNRVITAQAMDTNGLVGCWGTLPIIMPRNRATYNSLFLQLLELFPILKEVILRLIR